MPRQAHRELPLAYQRTLGAVALKERALRVAVRPNDHLDIGIETTSEGENRSRLVCVGRCDDDQPCALHVRLTEHVGARRIPKDHREPALAQRFRHVVTLLDDHEGYSVKCQLVGERSAHTTVANQHRVVVKLCLVDYRC